MKNKLAKPGYLIAGLYLGTMILCGNVFAKEDSPTEINITANKAEYTHLISEGEPIHLKVYEPLKLDITAIDEDGIESHKGYVGGWELYSKTPEDMSDDGELSKADLKVTWYTKAKYQIKISVKDKNGIITKKTIDVYVDPLDPLNFDSIILNTPKK